MLSFSANACKCPIKSLDESFSDSKAVLLVEVRSLVLTEVPDERYDINGKREIYEATFRTLESFKEPSEPIKILRAFGNCGLLLYPGSKYLVFVPLVSHIENNVSRCDSSFQYRSHHDYDAKMYENIKNLSHNKNLKSDN